ncbi:MAG: Re/Si-specific NAD(P)(+) transhydrogenase subunit alpha [Thermoleophilia bacterium]|nr:Re/Si-specific NAD(P)(+) transhydrogenase subunit alpha [Thermoleophilia bacterium]
MVIGVPREERAGESRVALSPTALPQLTKAGFDVVVESGAGDAAGYPDSTFTDRGARIGTRDDVFAADVVVQVNVLGGDPASTDLARVRPGQVVVGAVAPFARPELVKALAGTGVTLYALELVPRSTRAQSMDILSSQAAVAGYKAVLLAANELPKMFPLLTTAAGTIAPAKVFIVGAGVAGLAAIANARRLGALVEAYDVRPAAREEVESLGARFVELPLETGQDGGSGGYATALSAEMITRQQELMAKTVAASDVIITTAQVQGTRAPEIITTAMIRGMAAGSVVVDLAAEQGGNCEPTVAGETVLVDGVKVIGAVNLPGEIPVHASQLFGKNVANFLSLMVVDGKLDIDVDDDVIRQSVVARGGDVVNNRVREALGLVPLPDPEPEVPDPAPESPFAEETAK